MAPTPQEPCVGREQQPPLDGERVVISGMAGLYPNSPHVKELERILYNKENPVTDEGCRWTFTHPEVLNHTGKVPGLDRFDGQFFKVHFRQGNFADSMGRKIMEQTYQALFDAGVSPGQLYGKKVGVFVGACISETEKATFYFADSKTGLGITGCSKALFANRISYWLNLVAPSMAIDEACCSSIGALKQAYQAIKRGECESAIVGGCSLCLHPQSSVHYGRMIPLCSDGKTKCFDANADGVAKSEAINVLYLQRAKDAKRIYAEVVYVDSKFGNAIGSDVPNIGFFRDPPKLADFLEQFYEEAQVSPEAVEYVEAFGSAVPEADKAELEAIDKVFCKDRTDPLYIGSVMSNIGYGEAASGISAITKVLLGYRNGSLAPNLHCESPRRDVAALRDGRMQIVTEQRGFGRSYTAVNGISVTGVNAHVLLRGHYKPKDHDAYKSPIPRLVTISGRWEDAVQRILTDLKSRPIDPEEHALLHHFYQHRISGHMGRGYIILDTNEENKTVALAEQVKYYDDTKRPLWFVYSGMGSQWVGMGAQLMGIPVFAAAIERCHNALEPKGIDIRHIITSLDKTIFNNIMNAFVGIASIQIGLTDVLYSLEIMPDKIIGHSLGEIASAYADGCASTEETILSAYSLGLMSTTIPFVKGSMAAVAIGYREIKKLIPPEIEVACHNGPESSTISGPADKMKEFVAELSAKGIFAVEVSCANIAYHSRYSADAAPVLHKYLSEVIKEPKPFTKRFVSTSLLQEQWGKEEAKYNSAEYHTTNFLNPVYFEEACRLIPTNAVLVEIAPHRLLQAILKRSLPQSCKYIPLTSRGHQDNAFMVLDAVGKLYMEGFLPKVQALYPSVQFPVSTTTPMLSHLVEWAHIDRWCIPFYVSVRGRQAATCTFKISAHDQEHNYLKGNIIRGKNLYPFAAALTAAWDLMAMSLNKKRKQLSAEFRDVHLYAQPPLLEHTPLRLNVALNRGNGRFEIMNDDRMVASGYIFTELRDPTIKSFGVLSDSSEVFDFTSDDVYQMFCDRDYTYRGDFRSIYKVNKHFTEAQILWNENWVTFLDGILQLHALRIPHDTVSQPNLIERIHIDLSKHARSIITGEDNQNVMLAEVLEIDNVIRCGGVSMQYIQSHKLPVMENPVSLKTMQFVPRFGAADIDVATALQVFLQIVAENVQKDKLNVVEVVSNKNDDSIFNKVRYILRDIPGVRINFVQTSLDELVTKPYKNEIDLVLVQGLSSADGISLSSFYQVLQPDNFLINLEDLSEDQIRPSSLFRVVSTHSFKNSKLQLIKWRPTQLKDASTIVTVKQRSEMSLLSGTRGMLPDDHVIIILTSYPPVPGIKHMVKAWRKEANKNRIHLVMVSGESYLDELPELDLAYNILKDGVWGNECFTSSTEQKVGEHISLRSSRLGDLDSLHWVEVDAPTSSGIPVTVKYTSLNILDARRATGVVPFKAEKETSFCMDFSGVSDSGERVMGVVEGGAATKRVMARPELLWPVPAHFSLEDAATVPSAYAHAFYIIHYISGYRHGYRSNAFSLTGHKLHPRVLIHGASGGLGQAMISIQLALGCEVFATVSDNRKKHFLLKLFPQLEEDHIGNSRDETFRDMIRIVTKGQGCNIIINCLKPDYRHISLQCLAECGVMVDTDQIPNSENYSFGMYGLSKECNYHAVNFKAFFDKNSSEEMKQLQILISEGIARGYVRPLSRVTYSPEEVSRAFRLLASSRHRGRVLIRLQDKVTVVESRINCSSALAQVILCDEQNFGLQIGDRLINRGAKNLRLHCDNFSNNLHHKIQLWKLQNVNVEVFSQDLTKKENFVTLLSENNNIDSVEGIFVVATANDKTVNKLTIIISNLDLASRKLCPSLKYFAVINTDANVTLGEQTCLSRTKQKLPCTVLNLSTLRMPDDVNTNHSLSWRNGVNAIEKALKSSHSFQIAYPMTVEKKTLLQEITDLAGIKVPADVKHNTSLLDLGIDLVKVPLIYSFLRDAHNLGFLEENIPNLTIQRINELDDEIHDVEMKTPRGLGCFFEFVDSDELTATTDIVLLPTLANNSTKDNEFDVTQTYLYIIPGLEGHYNRFQTLCERLKLPALVLQPGLDFPSETVMETAQRYAKTLLKQVCHHKHFYLLGYESGVSVALEVAGILEDNGFTGTVFCLGSTPEEFKTLLNKELGEISTDEALQNAVARHMFYLMTGHTEGIDKALDNETDFEKKVEACIRMLRRQVSLSAEYARKLIEAAYSRVKAARSYKEQPRQLRSKLVLLQAAARGRRAPAGAQCIFLLKQIIFWQLFILFRKKIIIIDLFGYIFQNKV